MKATATIPVSAPLSMAQLEEQIGKRVPVTWLGSQLGNAIVSSVRLVDGVPYLDLEIDMKDLFHMERGDFSLVLADGEDQL